MESEQYEPRAKKPAHQPIDEPLADQVPEPLAEMPYGSDFGTEPGTDLGTDLGTEHGVTVAAREEARLVLGTLAGLGAVVLGIVAWSLLYAYAKRDYVGVSVVFGLLIGWVVREVSRRSDLTPRIVAAVLTALLCVFGSVIALAANTARVFGLPVLDVLVDTLPNTFRIVTERNALTYVIFAAAVVVAFLSAGPSKPKTPKTPKTPTRDADDTYST